MTASAHIQKFMLHWSRGILVLLLLAWVAFSALVEQRQYQDRLGFMIQENTQVGKKEAENIARHMETSVGNFHDIPALLAQDPLVRAALAAHHSTTTGSPGGAAQTNDELNDYLARVKTNLGPDEAWVMEPDGECIGASNSRATNSFVGVNFSDRDYFRQAAETQAVGQYAFGRRTRVPGLFFATRVVDHGQLAGVVAVKMNLDAFTNWLDTPDAFVVDGYGVVVLSRNSGLMLAALPGAPVEKLSVERRQERYRRDSFPALAITPWVRTNEAPFVLFNHEAPPQLLFEQAVPREGLRVFVPEPLPALPGLADEFVWRFLLMATAGGSLILLLGASLRYSTNQREANRTLVSQKNFLMEAERIARLGSWTCDVTTGVLELSEQAAEIFSKNPATPRAMTMFAAMAAAADRDQVVQALDQSLKEGTPFDIEYNLDQPAERVTMVHLQGRLVYDQNSRPVRVVGTVQDITARKQVEQELSHTVSLLKATLESTADGILVVDRDGKITNHNQRFLKMWQLPPEALAASETNVLADFLVSRLKNPESYQAKVRQTHEHPLAETFDLVEFKDGKIFERYSKPQLIDDQPVGRVWSFYDVTEQKRAEASVLETERRLRILIEATMDVIFLKDGEGRWQMINQAARKAYSLGDIDYQGKTAAQLAELVPRRRADFEYSSDSDLHIWNNYRPSRAEEYLADDDGRLHCYDVIKVPIYNADGTRQGLVMVGRDITDRKRIEKELFKSRETLQMVLNNIPHLVFWKNRDLVFEGCNLSMARDRGYADPADVIGKTDFDLDTPEAAENFRAVDREVMENNRPKLNFEQNQSNADGSISYFLINKVPLHDNEGRVIGLLGVCENITERKLLEAQVRQAQKMESIGRLAGGVAHDFNNLLTVICGYCEILLEESPLKDSSRDALSEIKKAGERAAGLTRQLLAFSRKQILEPAVMDLNTLVAEYEKMFRRLLGEHIELILQLSPKLGKIRADASHIDQVFLNLVVNARDAMAQGGQLFIETANTTLDGTDNPLLEEVVPGNYVCLTVRDTGCGMDEKTMAHIFEPFFTTKDLGKGTGLGLAMIFGFIKQSGGHVSVDSEVNVGSTFKIYLPEFVEPVA